ncbi:MAG TPA: VTT domain-containing protein [bacterium]|jgi:uncharacterized membrane protein YdjX (TVP38/TMEM64 family)|nr:VTT domain-containing protein [bacterium]
MEAPQSSPPDLPPAKAVSVLLGGATVLVAWRLGWAFLLWRLSGLHPNLDSFSSHRQDFEAWIAASPMTAWASFFLLYTLVCALCLDGTATLVVVAGALFGMWQGLALCTLGSTLGAWAAFAFARRFLGAWVQKHFHHVIKIVDHGLKRDGDVWLLSARMIPMVSYSLVNLILGVSDMKPRRFLLLSTLGLLPCNAAYIWAGIHLGQIHGSQDLMSPQLWASLCVVGILPLAFRLALRLHASLKRKR